MQAMGSKGPAATVRALAAAALREPLTARARAELLFCLVTVLVGAAVLAVAVALLVPGTADSVARAVSAVTVLLPVVLATGLARRLGAAHRRLAGRLLGERVPPPPPRRPGRGLAGGLGAGLRDGPGWRALAYTVLQPPVAALGLYAVWLWAGGLANLTYPFWWGMFRNHPPGVRLSPALAATPFPGGGFLRVGTYPGTFAVFGLGVVMVLAAPWVTRAVVALDRWLLRGLLGQGRLAERVRDLEQTRALAVDDAAALLRQVERDLHDGAQVRLATLAMHLGMAREKLASDGRPLDVEAARELVDAAHRNAKDALTELRDLARGIHPPVLDNGLADALATLAAGSAIPVELATDIPVRPTPAIETIAYFCAAELLANAAKHSRAGRIGLRATGHDGTLLLSVTDDGAGGADPAGGGLSGLAQRVSTVDGRLEVASPPGGPTRVTVRLPLRA
jgi:signal transduction histidine kinase